VDPWVSPWLYRPFPAACPFRFAVTDRDLSPRRPERAELPQCRPPLTIICFSCEHFCGQQSINIMDIILVVSPFARFGRVSVGAPHTECQAAQR